jgi:HlyD family secretion protein
MTYLPSGFSGSYYNFNLRKDQFDSLRIGSLVNLVLADGNRRIEARVAEIRARGEFARWRAARVVGDNDLNTLVVRADPSGPATARLLP